MPTMVRTRAERMHSSVPTHPAGSTPSLQGVGIKEGQVYARADGQTSSEFVKQLADYCQPRLHGIPIGLNLNDGRQVAGIVDQVDPRQGVTLESANGEVAETFSPEEIAAYYVAPDGPPDHSDELRGV